MVPHELVQARIKYEVTLNPGIPDFRVNPITTNALFQLAKHAGDTDHIHVGLYQTDDYLLQI